MTFMNEPDVLAGLPDWLNYVGGAAGFIAAAGLWIRQWLSSAKLDRAADDANERTLARLQAQLMAERDRADTLMREREAMATEIGSLRGEVHALRSQVESLMTMIREMRGAQA